MFLDFRAKFQKLKKKTQNSRKKLKLWEDFAPPERPSGVIKKAWLKYCFVPPDFFPICGSKKNLQENTIAGRVGGQGHA